MKKFGFELKLLATGLSFIMAFYVFMNAAQAPMTSEEVMEFIDTGENLVFPCVLIDPGHGGEDGGASSDTGVLEKDINLQISHRLYAVLKTLGIDCEMTRRTDTMLDGGQEKHRKMHDLKNRVLAAKSLDDCIFVSIHQNKFPQKKYSGTQVYYSKNDPSSYALAELIQASVRENLQPENNRQTKKATSSIYVLDNLSCPAVLTECGFLSNDSEAEKLTTDAYQKQIVCAIASGIVNFLASRTQTGE